MLRTDASDGGLGDALLQEHDGMDMSAVESSVRQRLAIQQLNASVWDCSGQLNGYTLLVRYGIHTRDRSSAFSFHEPLHMQIYCYRVRIVKGTDNTTAKFLSCCGL